jgi:hypothetical protein
VETILWIIFMCIGACWLLAAIQNSRMFQMFRKKYPEIAKKKILGAFDNFVDPEKFWFFYRKENVQLLRQDNDIWKLRQQIKTLLILSLILLAVLIFIGIFLSFIL